VTAADLLAQDNNLVISYHAFYQLFTSIFVTYSGTDAVFNAIAIIILDIFLDSSFNRTRYFAVFFFSAFLGNILTLFIGNFFSIVLSAGASGGIFGLYAATFAYRWAEEKRIDRGALIFFIAIFGSSLGFDVNWIAHVGGSMGGFISGPLMYYALKNKLANYESISNSSPLTMLIVWGAIFLMIVGSAIQFYLFVT
jgi:rhomboid protease GluP